MDKKYYISDRDPPVYDIINAKYSTSSNLLIACDHAGKNIPICYHHLGLHDDVFNRHIAYDIGARSVTNMVANFLKVPAICANYSRLLLDLNRRTDDYTIMRPISDGTIIPKNIGMSSQEQQWRIEHFFIPYHHKITDILQEMKNPAFIVIHSFTPIFQGHRRDVMLGVMTGRHKKWSDIFMTEFQQQYPDIIMKENEPYRGDAPYDYTVPHHALDKGYDSLALEIRQDLIDNDDKCQQWGNMLAPIFQKTLEQVRRQQ